MEIKKIETYSLFEFCQQVQEAIIKGWRFDLESNENAPTAFGSMLIANMVKAQDIISSPQEIIIKDNTEDNIKDTPAKRGRPAK